MIAVGAPRSRECETCRGRWPLGTTVCPVCERKTQISGLRPTRSPRQANEILFARYCEDREVKRIAEGRIAPEGLGRREARELIREVAEWERRYAA